MPNEIDLYSQVSQVVDVFNQSLIEYAESLGICEVHFLSRDGYLFFNRFQHKTIKAKYLYVSRQVVLPLSISDNQSLLEYINYHSSNFTKRELLEERFSMSDEFICENIDKDWKTIICDPVFKEAVLHLKSGAKLYYKNELLNRKVLLVDLGYKGSLQKSLQQAFPEKQFFGYYLLSETKVIKKNLGKNFRSATSFKKDDFLACNLMVLEYIFQAPEGSLKRIIKNKQGVDMSFIDTNPDYLENISLFLNKVIKSKSLKSAIKDDSNISNLLSSLILSAQEELPKLISNDNLYVEDGFSGQKKRYLIDHPITVKSGSKKSKLKKLIFKPRDFLIDSKKPVLRSLGSFLIDYFPSSYRQKKKSDSLK